MAEFILTARDEAVAIVTLNRPDVLNAWHAAMRGELVTVLEELDAEESVRAIVLTGAGKRAFGAGQDLKETKSFDPHRAEAWVGEWRRLYDTIRGLGKPIVAALNGVAAGSAFQVALLCDFRVGHAGTRMGQPEINAGIASTIGPWIMREMIGLARTIDLTLTGRLMEGEESHRLGVINRLVAAEQVLPEAIALAKALAAKPPLALHLDKQRFREMTEPGFRECLEAGVRIQRESYGSGEPARMMQAFLDKRGKS